MDILYDTTYISLDRYALLSANRYLAKALAIDKGSGSGYRRDLLGVAMEGYEEVMWLGSRGR